MSDDLEPYLSIASEHLKDNIVTLKINKNPIISCEIKSQLQMYLADQNISSNIAHLDEKNT